MSAFKVKRSACKSQYLPELQRVSSALRRLATAASANLGSDCYIHAAIGQQLLNRLGIATTIVAGFAAWRIGNGDGDVILHAPNPGMPTQPGGVAYHVWLEFDNCILDFTTYQLRFKAAQLDALDGQTTTVKWCPDFLYAPRSSISSIKRVIQKKAGLFCYNRDPGTEALIFSTAPTLDAEDVETAWLLYQNQELQVFGPNHSKTEGTIQ